MAKTRTSQASKPSIRELQKEMTRERIIEAALAVFDDKGFAVATIDDIAVEAEVARATLYSHFDSKTEILRAAVSRLPELLPLLVAILAANSRSARRAGIEELHAYWLKHLAPVWSHARQAAAIDPEMDDWMLRFVGDQRSLMQAALERGGVPAKAAEARALMTISLWDEYVHRVNTIAKHLDRAAAVDALTDLFEAAVKPPRDGVHK